MVAPCARYAAKMPAVLVHGVPNTSALWDDVRAHLPRDDIVAVDLPGFGTPVPAGVEPTKESYAAWLIDRIEALGEPVDLVGHDWGSILVQRAASLRPELIRTLAFGSGPVDDTYVWHQLAQLWQTPEVGEQVMEAMTPDALSAGLAADIGEAAAAEFASHLDDTMKECILGLYRSAVTVGAEWQPGVEAVAGRFPSLVLWGRHDEYVAVEFGERAAARLHGRLLRFDDGHWWPVTKPRETATALEELWSPS
jgi:pimeloyl-ACP methyl ester carboxylesterase